MEPFLKPWNSEKYSFSFSCFGYLLFCLSLFVFWSALSMAAHLTGLTIKPKFDHCEQVDQDFIKGKLLLTDSLLRHFHWSPHLRLSLLLLPFFTFALFTQVSLSSFESNESVWNICLSYPFPSCLSGICKDIDLITENGERIIIIIILVNYMIYWAVFNVFRYFQFQIHLFFYLLY